MIKITVSNSQRVKAEIQKKLKRLNVKKFVTIGIHEGAPQPKDKNGNPSNINMATLGAILDQGNSNIPARPWLKPGVESGNKEYLKMVKDSLLKTGSIEGSLDTIGIVAVGKVQLFMTELKNPPNADSTKQRKGSDNPLIDDGELRRSVTHMIQDKAPREGL